MDHWLQGLEMEASGSPIEEIIVNVPDTLLINPALFVRVIAQ